MIDLGFFEKIKALRDKFNGEHPDALKQINEWEKRLQELSLVDDFINLNTTKEIVKKIKERMKDCIRKRAFDDKLSSESLKIYKAQYDELKYILSIFQPTYQSELEMLNKQIEEELLEI